MHCFIFLPVIIPVIFAVLVAPRNPIENGVFFEGDIAIPNRDGDRNAILPSQRWIDGKVPYVISYEEGPFDEAAVKRIRTAMRIIMSKTCIRFVMRETETDYIKIFSGIGCWSYVGRRGGEQKVSLDPTCTRVETVTHELLHAIGFEHEHSRPDRDDYVTIHWDNIQPEYYYAFNKLNPWQTLMLTPFDYDSIMLYDSEIFVKGNLPMGFYGMTDKQGNRLTAIYNKTSMSESDIKRINILYECSGKI